MAKILRSFATFIPGKIPGATDVEYAAFHSKYVLSDKILGNGSFAQVRLGTQKQTMQSVAIKIVNKKSLSPRELNGLLREVEILKLLDHENVVKIYDWYNTEKAIIIIQEYVSGGELYQSLLLKDYTEADVKRVIYDLANALKHCKGNGVIHRDIKPQNLLVTKDKQIKLVDFNLSTKVDKDQADFSLLQTMCGTPNYVAPEVLSMQPYSYKCDIWSLGVICYLLLSGGYLPFNVDEEGEVGKNLLLEQVREGRWDFNPVEAWMNISDEAKEFLKGVMNPKVEKRFDYDQLISHRWMKEAQTETKVSVSTFRNTFFRRKMLAAGKVLLAAEAFKALANEDVDSQIDKKGKKEDKINEPAPLKINPLPSLTEESSDGFVMFDL